MTDRLHPWHIVFAGGGTGGHLFPGLAVAEQLRDLLDVRITFAGCGKPLERDAVITAGYDYLPLPCRPTPPRARDLPRFVVDNLQGYRQAVAFLRQQPADVVVGLGGYVSFPMARAAVSVRTPLVLLEQNAVPGRVTRWLAPIAALICTSFDDSSRHLRAIGPIRTTGNPVRRGFHRRAEEPATDASKLRRSNRLLLIMGGSLGARSLNECVPRVLHQLGPQLTGWQIIHQAGQRDSATTQALYQQLGISAQVTPFIRDLPRVLHATTLAICRAGGTTLAELASAGVPALLVPYPFASNDHQRLNAQAFVAAGAARQIDQRCAPTNIAALLAAELGALLAAPHLLVEMSASMRRLARPDAAWHIAMLLRDFTLRRSAAA